VSDVSGSCPNLTFTVQRRTVFTDSNTSFRSGNCRQVDDSGRNVVVNGEVREGDRVYARTVEIRGRD